MRNPHDTIIRNVLLFPADGSAPAPRIVPMPFNEAGARANPKGFYTVNVDLRGVYGARNMYATRQHGWDISDESCSRTNINGTYDLFHNISPRLPVNATMARIVGVDPRKAGRRPLWRGDVVVVKASDWPEPITIEGGAHRDYLDVKPEAVELFCTRLIPEWYSSDGWLNFLNNEQRFNEVGFMSEASWPLCQKLYPFLANQRSGFDEKSCGKFNILRHMDMTLIVTRNLVKNARMIDRLKRIEVKRVERQELVCVHCGANGSSLSYTLKVCGRCRNKLAWKVHKTVCRVEEKGGSGSSQENSTRSRILSWKRVKRVMGSTVGSQQFLASTAIRHGDARRKRGDGKGIGHHETTSGIDSMGGKSYEFPTGDFRRGGQVPSGGGKDQGACLTVINNQFDQ
ncbi:hypothetical protein DFH06DRAFT_1130610 [Mycena polygramma]|nr:hypothetical protein DFH06DRAFT_1130610 [Mycena polygramma]